MSQAQWTDRAVHQAAQDTLRFSQYCQVLRGAVQSPHDGHFAIEHAARNGSGRFFNFNGTAGLLRRTMIDDAGGWQHDTLTEDSDLSYRAQLAGGIGRLKLGDVFLLRSAGLAA